MIRVSFKRDLVDEQGKSKVYLINFKYEISLAPAFAFRGSK